ncbi:MAG TPA: MraY family glycosyltransferase [Acidimicrobiales bacterium]|nr:MraY family glycosyltransferase [Acidimicrobiales bacterium]
MALIVALLVAAACTPLAIVVARRTGVVDHPGPLKVQARPIPYLGGVAVFAGVAAGGALSAPRWLLPLALALVLGVADDVADVSSRVRLACEVAIAGAVAVAVPTGLPGVLGPAAVVVATIVVINAVNLIDGLDGLAAGVALASALGFAAVLPGDGRTFALALAGALVGFLVFNRPPARIYLGDGGAYLIGTALAVLLASAWRPGAPSAASVGALLLVAVPVAEVVFAVIRRLAARQPLFCGDRDHVYDQLVRRGWGTGAATLALVALQAVLVVAGYGAGRLALAGSVAAVGGVALALVVAAGATGFLVPGSSRR